MEAHFLLGNFGWKFWTTLQDVSIISEISRLVGAKLSYHSLSDRNFWYFDADDKYGLLVLTKLVRSIWLDIAFFLRVYGRGRSQGPLIHRTPCKMKLGGCTIHSLLVFYFSMFSALLSNSAIVFSP